MDYREAFDEMFGNFQVFYHDVVEEAELRDVLMMLLVPVVIVTVFLLPESVQQGLILDFQSVSFFNLLSYAFVHRGFNHFANNLFSYVTLAPLAYLLCVLAGEKKFFRYTWLSFVLVFPVLIAVIELASPVTPSTSAGFSGVDSAFLGFLPISLVLFLRNRISEETQVVHAVVLFLVAAGAISFIYSGVSGLLLATVAATVLLAAFYTYRIGIGEFKKVFSEIASMQGYLELVLLALLLFLFSPMMIFPANISQGPGTVDIFAHYLGLTLGFFLPLLYLMYRNGEIDDSLPDLLAS